MRPTDSCAPIPSTRSSWRNPIFPSCARSARHSCRPSSSAPFPPVLASREPSKWCAPCTAGACANCHPLLHAPDDWALSRRPARDPARGARRCDQPRSRANGRGLRPRIRAPGWRPGQSCGVHPIASDPPQRVRGGVRGLYDIYGFALAAQPGWSQGRPDNNTSSRLIVYGACPLLRTPTPLSRRSSLP